jgi:tetratricopeptide (TPR) repeat protein
MRTHRGWNAIIPFIFLSLLAGCWNSSPPADQATASPKENAGLAAGRTAMEAGDFNLARETLASRLASDPDDVAALELAGMNELRAGEHARADEIGARLCELQPDSAAGWTLRGESALYSGKFNTSLEHLTAALERDPRHVRCLYLRGMVHAGRGETEAALKDLDSVELLDSKQPPQFFANRAVLRMEMGLLKEAEADATRAIEIAGEDRPMMVRVLRLRVQCRMSQDRAEACLDDLATLLRLEPDSPDHHLALRDIYRRLGRRQDALAETVQARLLTSLHELNAKIARQPTPSTEHLMQRGMVLSKLNRLEAALGNFNEAMKCDAESPLPYLMRCSVWLRQGEFQKAVDDCNAAIERGAGTDAHAVRGEAYLGLHDFDRALADFSTSRRLDDSVARALRLRADAREARGDLAGAAADRREAAEIEGDAPLPGRGNVQQASLELEDAHQDRVVPPAENADQ